MNVLQKFRLDKKVAIVTGASRGLGESIALGLAEAGADLAVIARSDPELRKVADRIRQLGRDSLPLRLDITAQDAPQKIVDSVLNWKGTIDILCNNAGLNIRVPADDYSVADWESVMKLNLQTPFAIAQAVGRFMIRNRSGKIINVGSVSSFLGSANLISYASSKGGILLMTKVLAVEWGKYNIQVNCIIPGIYKTQFTKTAMDRNPELYEFYLQRIPSGRWGNPEDLNGAAVFLASHASDYVTGTTLVVDGGYLAG